MSNIHDILALNLTCSFRKEVPMPLPPAIIIGGKLLFAGVKIWLLKEVTLTTFRFAQNGFDWTGTLKDLINDHRFGAQVGADTFGLGPALYRLYTSTNIADMRAAAIAIKKARDHLPEKTLEGLNKNFALDQVIEANIAYGLKQVATSLLKSPWFTLDPNAQLQQTYLGLYLLSRCGLQLELQEQGRIIGDVLTAHTTRDSNADQAVKPLLQSWTMDKGEMFAKTVAMLPEALNSGIDSKLFGTHVARAMGADIPISDEDTLLEEFAAPVPKESQSAA